MPPPATKEIVQGFAIITNILFDEKYPNLSNGALGFCQATIVRGKITLDSRVRVFRGNKKIHDGTIFALIEYRRGYNSRQEIVDCIDDKARYFEICFDKVRAFEKGDRIESYVPATQELSEGIDCSNLENLQGFAVVGKPRYGGLDINVIAGNYTSHGRIFRKGREVYSGKIEWDGPTNIGEIILDAQTGDLIEFYPD